MDEISKRIAMRREKLGMTLDALAKAIGSTKSYIWEMENRPKIRPSADIVFRLARALKTTPAFLMGESVATESEEEVLGIYRQLDRAGQALMVRIARVLTEPEDD